MRPGTWLLLAVAGGCTRGSAPAPVSWSRAAPGLEVAEVALPGAGSAWAARYDPDAYALQLEWAPHGLRVPASLASGWIVAMNGGYFEPDLRPSGLLIIDGRQIQAGSGRHGAMVLEGGRARLLRFNDLTTRPGASALQAWPFLIEPDGADGIRGDDGKRARRSAFGLDGRGRGLLLSVPVEGISLFQLMKLCRRLGAVVALNLDGGTSTGFALSVGPRWVSPSETDVSNALVLRRRTPAG